MYQLITYDRTQGHRPTRAHAFDLSTLLRLVYEAGRHDQEVIIDEFTWSDLEGEGVTSVFDSQADTRSSTE
jgi:hypothetical protein